MVLGREWQEQVGRQIHRRRSGASVAIPYEGAMPKLHAAQRYGKGGSAASGAPPTIQYNRNSMVVAKVEKAQLQRTANRKHARVGMACEVYPNVGGGTAYGCSRRPTP